MSKNFMDCVKDEISTKKTLTENGAVAYKSTGKELLDFNFKLTSYRNFDEADIANDFAKVFYEEPITAVKYLFYVGDIREGLGERKVFKTCFNWLAYNKPEYAKKLCGLIPEYSRWDILVQLINIKPLKKTVVDMIDRQLKQDRKSMEEGKPISLLAKWMPSENASSKETMELARKLHSALHMSPKVYRRTLSRLRAYLDVVEVKMSSNRWSEIDYETVPSKANVRYTDAFLRNDESRRVAYLKSLANGNAKINASVTLPHEVVSKYGCTSWFSSIEHNEALEQIWKSIPNITTEDTLVIRDGSGSMLTRIGNGRCTALDVSTALAIYCSENCTGGFKDKFITFSSEPKVVSLEHCKTLREKLLYTYKYQDISNTDIYATMKLILKTAIMNHMEQKDLPKTILILSDMQFDGLMFHMNKTLFERIKEDFEFAGYKLPRICFWNLHAYGAETIPMQDNESGLILCSGFSTNNLRMFLSGELDPLKVLLSMINVERYDVIERLIK